MESNSQTTKEPWLHFEGHVHFLIKLSPFRLLIRTRGRKISHREIIVELDYLEHDFTFSADDLASLFPVGGSFSIQLIPDMVDSTFVVATAELMNRHFQAHSLQLHLGFKRVDDELEDLLGELQESGGRTHSSLH